jgi:hypothetical protein
MDKRYCSLTWVYTKGEPWLYLHGSLLEVGDLVWLASGTPEPFEITQKIVQGMKVEYKARSERGAVMLVREGQILALSKQETS